MVVADANPHIAVEAVFEIDPAPTNDRRAAEILPVSARLIVNQGALKTKRAGLQPLIDAFAQATRR